jgi:hypothetical protein
LAHLATLKVACKPHDVSAPDRFLEDQATTRELWSTARAIGATIFSPAPRAVAGTRKMEILMKMLVVGTMLAALVASPAVAQSYDSSLGSGNIVRYVDHQNRTVDPRGSGGVQFPSPYTAYGAVTPFGSPGAAKNGANQMSAARASAVRECSTMAQRYQDTTWGSTMKSHHYRTCMAQRGHVE